MENVIWRDRDTQLPQVKGTPGISSVEITAVHPQTGGCMALGR